MSLERWLKPDKRVKKTEENKDKPLKKAQSKDFSVKKETSNISMQAGLKLNKYVLICTKAKCKYQKTIMKKNLSENDIICPKCNSQMKVK